MRLMERGCAPTSAEPPVPTPPPNAVAVSPALSTPPTPGAGVSLGSCQWKQKEETDQDSTGSRRGCITRNITSERREISLGLPSNPPSQPTLIRPPLSQAE